jgi:hypothetical protein
MKRSNSIDESILPWSIWIDGIGAGHIESHMLREKDFPTLELVTLTCQSGALSSSNIQTLDHPQNHPRSRNPGAWISAPRYSSCVGLWWRLDSYIIEDLPRDSEVQVGLGPTRRELAFILKVWRFYASKEQEWSYSCRKSPLGQGRGWMG